MPKIFVTLGTHPQEFNRVLREIDSLVKTGKLKGEVFAQTGHSKYVPKNYKARDFLSLDEFSKKMKEADIIITHAGEGNVGIGKNLGKKIIVIPRRKEFNEHTNDHQLELAATVEEKKLGLVAWQENELEKKLSEIKGFTPANVPRGAITELLNVFVKEKFT